MMKPYLYPNKDNNKSIDLPYHKPSESVRNIYQLNSLEKQRERLCGNNPECKWNNGTIKGNYMVFQKVEDSGEPYKRVTTKFIGNIQADLFETNKCHGYMKRPPRWIYQIIRGTIWIWWCRWLEMGQRSSATR